MAFGDFDLKRAVNTFGLSEDRDTDGSIWRFLKLEGSMLSIDQPEYYLRDVAQILGILMNIARA